MYNVVGTQKIRLDDMVLLRTQSKSMFNLIDKKILRILRPKIFLYMEARMPILMRRPPLPHQTREYYRKMEALYILDLPMEPRRRHRDEETPEQRQTKTH